MIIKKNGFHKLISVINIKKFISQVLISIILVLISIIYINSSNTNKNNYLKYFLNNTFKFNKGLNIYKNLVGNPIILKEEGLTSQVINDAVYEKEPFLDGLLLTYQTDSFVKTYKSGLVVFSGIKENYGNTIIIQGNDGIDIWYGNLEDASVNLYDYVEKDKIIGKPKNNKLFIKSDQSGEVVDINNYLNEI